MLKAELEAENKRLQEEKEIKDKEFDGMKAQMDQIQSMLQEKGSLQGKGNPMGGLEQVLSDMVKKQDESNEPIFIGSLDTGGVTVNIDGRDEEITELISFTLVTTSNLIKNPKYRELFRSGALYFEDKKWYKHFRMSDKNALYDETILNTFTDKSKIIDKLNALTQHKTDLTATANLLFKIAILEKEKKLALSLEDGGIIEDYFGARLQDVRRQLKYLKSNENKPEYINK
jgi:hypothetical protein